MEGRCLPGRYRFAGHPKKYAACLALLLGRLPHMHTTIPKFWLAVCLIKVQNPELCACLNNANAKMLLAILVAGSFTVLASPFPAPKSFTPLLAHKPGIVVLPNFPVCPRMQLCVCVCVGRNVSLQFRWRAETVSHTHAHSNTHRMGKTTKDRKI